MRLFVVPLVALIVLAGPAAAQEGGSGPGPAGGGSGLPSGIDAPRTIPQQFASKLKLDKIQAPAVDEILTAAAIDAAPVAQQMLVARQHLLNAARSGRPEELKTAEDAYAAEAAKIAGVEAAAFAKVFALLKPGQQKDAPQAFALIAGLISNPPAGGSSGRSGTRGPGGDR